MVLVLKNILPDHAKYRARIILNKVRFFGNKRYCPVCNSHVSSFKPYGLIQRDGAVCPVCNSLERHRLVWLFFKRKTSLFKEPEKKMLHVAPEKMISEKLRYLNHIEYLSGDLNSKKAMVKMDITDIPYPDNYFDVIYCSHVLQHVLDDRKAMCELQRVLKPSGWSILQVPINGDHTIEDSTIIDPVERGKIFGGLDFVRSYGPDYCNRLKECGFDVEKINAREITSELEMEKMNIHRNENIFYCTKA